MNCRRCGLKLAPDGLDGLCPRCLLARSMGLDADHDAAAAESSRTHRADTALERVGPYQLLEEIGEGGFGIVYLAEQETPVSRRVALKILKPGMDTREVVKRFEAERQALAMMDHSNIARVLDGGATDDGRPYFVMELVRGARITDFCDARRSTTGERLKLFFDVCQAVQHAHQKGVIHRDIKPSNVLVTEQDGRAVAKVIDFGIAKAMEPASTEKTLFTRFNQYLGTPAYMSPEQAGLGGLDVDTRSDVYSLGVLLYELLTGRPPFTCEDLIKSGFDEVLRTIREKEPPRPSTKLKLFAEKDLIAVAARRRAEPRALNRLLLGDLDWIVMKAMEKDRARRYGTPDDLVADLQRHLRDEPIVARPPSAAYRFQKLVRRHRRAFSAAAVVVLALAAGVSLSGWMYLRERAAKKVGERLNRATTNVFQTHNLQANNLDVAKLLEAAEKMIGNSVPLLEEALKANKAGLGATNPAVLEIMDNLASAYQAAGRLTNAIALREEEFGLRRTHQGIDHPKTIESMDSLAAVYLASGRDADSVRLREELVQFHTNKLGRSHTESINSMETLARTYESARRFSNAFQLYEEVLQIKKERLGTNHMSTANSMFSLANAYFVANRLNEAVPLYKEGIRITWARYGPENRLAAYNQATLGMVLIRQKQFADAVVELRPCLAVYQEQQPDDWFHFHVQSLLGGALLGQTNFTDAEPLLRSGYDGMKARQPQMPKFARFFLRDALERLVQLYQAKGNAAQAALWQRELEEFQKASADKK
jgi:serine/threonine protein kinase